MSAETSELGKFVQWFRNDLVYKAPEVWPGHISWFLAELMDRFDQPHAAAMDELEGIVGDMAGGLEVGGNDDSNLADYLHRLRAVTAKLNGEES